MAPSTRRNKRRSSSSEEPDLAGPQQKKLKFRRSKEGATPSLIVTFPHSAKEHFMGPDAGATPALTVMCPCPAEVHHAKPHSMEGPPAKARRGRSSRNKQNLTEPDAVATPSLTAIIPYSIEEHSTGSQFTDDAPVKARRGRPPRTRQNPNETDASSKPSLTVTFPSSAEEHPTRSHSTEEAPAKARRGRPSRGKQKGSPVVTFSLSAEDRITEPDAGITPSLLVPILYSAEEQPTKSHSTETPPTKAPRGKIPRNKQKADQHNNSFPVDKRPKSWGMPEVWAETRPELCEALPYFKTRQGSTYHLDGIIRGKLLDLDLGQRTYMDEECIVTRCGGGMGENELGEPVQTRDVDVSHGSITCYQTTKNSRVPLQVIIGSNNIDCPSQVPYRYCVMGLFHITDIWAEKSNGKILMMIRMEKVDLYSKSWWAAKDSKLLPGAGKITPAKAIRRACILCENISPTIFKKGWICLQQTCPAFWTMNGVPIDYLEASYNEAFIKERTAFNGFEAPFMTTPKPLDPAVALPVSRQCWKGMVCPNCGRCIQRVHWNGWRCQNNKCDYMHTVPHKVTPSSALLGDLTAPFSGHALSEDQHLGGQITCRTGKHGLWRIHVYNFTEDVVAFHFHANEAINAKIGGADSILNALQTQDIGLERRPLRRAVVQGTYSAHFSKNFGLPYDYVVSHEDNSTPFHAAPTQIREVLRRVTWAAQHIVGEQDTNPFNEVLVVGYFEGGKMGYHDDGETTLGPTVMSLSMGCPALMSWRMKFKYYSGFVNRNRERYDPTIAILPGCFRAEKRAELNAMASTLTSPELTKKAKELLKGCPLTPPVVLKMKLRHGDIVGMHGVDLQKYYEHEVIPISGDLRFALTCRHVKPDMIPEDLRHNGDIDLDEAHPYDGDMELYEEFKKEQVAAGEKRGRRG